MTDERLAEGEVAGWAVGIVARTSRMRWNGLRTGGIDMTVSLELADDLVGGEGNPPNVDWDVVT